MTARQYLDNSYFILVHREKYCKKLHIKIDDGVIDNLYETLIN